MLRFSSNFHFLQFSGISSDTQIYNSDYSLLRGHVVKREAEPVVAPRLGSTRASTQLKLTTGNDLGDGSDAPLSLYYGTNCNANICTLGYSHKIYNFGIQMAGQSIVQGCPGPGPIPEFEVWSRTTAKQSTSPGQPWHSLMEFSRIFMENIKDTILTPSEILYKI